MDKKTVITPKDQAEALTAAFRKGEKYLRAELIALAHAQHRRDLVLTYQGLSLERSVKQLEDALAPLGLRLAIVPVEYH